MSKSLKIAGMGRYISENTVTNDDLSKTLDTSDEWIRTRTGIRERHITTDSETNSVMASQACRTALDRSGIDPSEIDVFMLATFTPDMQTPSTSCVVQSMLGLDKAWCFDLNAACSGFLYCLELAKGLVEKGPEKNILICGSDHLSRVVDWEDRSTCVLFGDGAAAFVVTSEGDYEHEIKSFHLKSDGNLSTLIEMPYSGTKTPLTPENITERKQFLQMDGPSTFKNAIKNMVSSCEKLLTDMDLDIDDVTWLIPHQANIRIMEGVGKRLGIDIEQVYSNVDKYGNMSASSIPFAISEMDENNVLNRGDILLLTAFGAGLTWGAGIVEW